MKTTKLTWTGDVHAACKAVGFTTRHVIFNDRHKTCRRLKFDLSADGYNRRTPTQEQLAVMQKVIQERRPDLNVTVSTWTNRFFGNVVVYYRPKTGYYMNHVWPPEKNSETI
jgi:hypothetical protein